MCPEVTEAPNQAFSFADDFGKAVLKLIQAKTIAVLGTVTPGSITLQYLFDPMIHHNDLSGMPTIIICNSSNKNGEFSLVKIKTASFRLFPYITPQNYFAPFGAWQRTYGGTPLRNYQPQSLQQICLCHTSAKLLC